MKYIYCLLLPLLFVLSAHCQNVTNADFRVEGSNIVINYTLDAIADIDIYCSIDGGKTFGLPLQNISGDVGSNVMPGNKTAVWHVFAERDMIYSNQVSFKIKVKESKKTFDIDGYLLEMVKINGGTFEMGQHSEHATDMSPAHDVTLSDFYMAKYEVSVELFKKFIDATAYKTDADKYGGSYLWGRGYWELSKNVNWKCDTKGHPLDETDYDLPVIHISYNDALAFCSWLKQKTGENFRLPTEAEWEYAASGGEDNNGYLYSGSDELDEVAWYFQNSYEEGTQVVGLKTPNELGLYDMSGNVSEWCNDIYGDYLGGSQMNPSGSSEGHLYVFRGGSWHDQENKCSVHLRFNATPNTRRFNLGFRLAL